MFTLRFFRSLTACLTLVTLPLLSYAGDKLPSQYQGPCPQGYANAVTDPADTVDYIPGDPKIYKLPPNVCVRRRGDFIRPMIVNFSKDDFLSLDGGKLIPLYQEHGLSTQDYEPIIGHFTGDYGLNDVQNAMHPQYQNYSGAHPIFIYRPANAAVRLQQGLYLIDKQTQVKGYNTARCPTGYSTLGDSQTCYSKHNYLTLNEQNKLVLSELTAFKKYSKQQECPLGYAMVNGLGSTKGICTPVKALVEGVEHFGLIMPKGRLLCADNEYTKDQSVCLPQVTAIVCNKKDQPKRSVQKYAYYWPTNLVTLSNALEDFAQNYARITTGTLSVDSLQKIHNTYKNDDEFIALSPLDSGQMNAFYLYSSKSCDKLWDNGGWSTEPMAAFW
jgi:hypothetical protein